MLKTKCCHHVYWWWSGHHGISILECCHHGVLMTVLSPWCVDVGVLSPLGVDDEVLSPWCVHAECCHHCVSRRAILWWRRMSGWGACARTTVCFSCTDMERYAPVPHMCVWCGGLYVCVSGHVCVSVCVCVCARVCGHYVCVYLWHRIQESLCLQGTRRFRVKFVASGGKTASQVCSNAAVKLSKLFTVHITTPPHPMLKEAQVSGTFSVFLLTPHILLYFNLFLLATHTLCYFNLLLLI